MNIEPKTLKPTYSDLPLATVGQLAGLLHQEWWRPPELVDRLFMVLSSVNHPDTHIEYRLLAETLHMLVLQAEEAALDTDASVQIINELKRRIKEYSQLAVPASEHIPIINLHDWGGHEAVQQPE